MTDETGKPDLGKQGDLIYGLITFVVNLFPAIAEAIFPGGKMEDKGADFLFVYISTLPLSLALTAIGLMWMREWGDSDQARALASVAILTVSAVIGWGFGTAQDLAFFEGVHGNAFVWIAYLVAYILGTYLVLYGPALWIAAMIASMWAAHWLNTKLPEDL
jgi:hypothetical protein